MGREAAGEQVIVSQRPFQSSSDVFKASDLNLTDLPLPLRPIFLVNDPDARLPSFPPASTLGFFPVLCVSASQYVRSSEDRRRPGGWEYHQGAGDDHEAWAMGMDARDFWEWRGELLEMEPGELEKEVKRRVEEKQRGEGREKGRGQAFLDGTLIAPTERLYLSTLPQALHPTIPTIAITVSSSSSASAAPSPFSYSSSSSSSFPIRLDLAARPSVKDPLTPLFAPALAFASHHLHSGSSVLLACEEGKALSVGLALCLLQSLFDDEGRILPLGPSPFDHSCLSFDRKLTKCDEPRRRTIEQRDQGLDP